MNTKTTIGLVLVLAIAVVCFVLLEDTPPGTTSGPTGHKLLFKPTALPPDQVATIVIRRPGHPDAVLSREDDAWVQTAPVRYPLSDYPQRGKNIIETVAKLQYVQRFEPGAEGSPSLAETQLQTPDISVTLKGLRSTDDGAQEQFTHTVHLGKRIAGNGYVRIDDDSHVYVVNNDLHSAVEDGDVKSWRNTKLVDLPTEGRAQALRIESPHGVMLARKQENRWRFAGVHDGRVARKAVEELISDLETLWIDEFVEDQAEDLGRYGLAQPRYTVRFSTAAIDNGAAATSQPAEDNTDEASVDYVLRLGNAADLQNEAYFATWSTGDEPSRLVFTVSNSAYEKFHLSADDLRDPRIAVADAAAVTDIRFETRGEPAVHLQKGVDGWAFAEDHAFDWSLDISLAIALIEQLLDIEAESFRASYQPADDPQYTITLSTLNANSEQTIRIYREGEGADAPHVALREGETTGYVVDVSKLERLDRLPLAVRSRRIIDAQPDQLAGLVLKRPDFPPATFTFTVAEQGPLPAEAKAATPDGWAMADHKSFEQQALQKLVAALLPLHASRWLKEAPQADDTWHTLTLTLADGRTHELRVDPRTRAARLATIEQPFEVDMALTDALGVEFRERDVLALNVDDIEAITVERDGRTIRLERDAEGNVVNATNDEPLDEGAAAGLFDELRGLRVERWLARSDEPLALATYTVEMSDGGKHRIRLLAPSKDAKSDVLEVDGKWYRIHDVVRSTFNADIIPLPGTDDEAREPMK